MGESFLPSPPDHVPAELMVDFDFFAIPEGMADPAEIWHGLVRSGVPKIFYTRHNGGHWVFLNYDDIVEGYRDFESFSNYQTPIPPIEPFPTMQPQGVDPPAHNVFRKLLAPLFTPAGIRKLNDDLDRRSKALVDEVARNNGCDFIADYAAKLPTGAFLHIMGLPEEQLPAFLELSNTFFRSTDPEERKQNVEQIYAILNAMYDDKRRNPADDLATLILNAKDEQGELLPYADKLDCAFLLFVAGLDTVTNTMAYIWKYLATTPQARAYLRDRLDNHDAMNRAVEELFRINAVSNIYRRVKQDMHYKGIFMKKNDRVILPNTIANRDPAIFAEPGTIDLDREVNRHVTFGVGPHRCIGSHLAKREVTISIQNWLRRIPEFGLSENLPPGQAFGGSVMGFRSLPLVWTR